MNCHFQGCFLLYVAEGLSWNDGELPIAHELSREGINRRLRKGRCGCSSESRRIASFKSSVQKAGGANTLEVLLWSILTIETRQIAQESFSVEDRRCIYFGAVHHKEVMC